MEKKRTPVEAVLACCSLKVHKTMILNFNPSLSAERLLHCEQKGLLFVHNFLCFFSLPVRAWWIIVLRKTTTTAGTRTHTHAHARTQSYTVPASYSDTQLDHAAVDNSVESTRGLYGYVFCSEWPLGQASDIWPTYHVTPICT